MAEHIQNTKPEEKEFTRRFDFYWQSIAMYAVALLIYSVLKGSVSEATLTLVLYDPVVILLSAIIIGTGGTLLVRLYKNARIRIGQDYILFKASYREKKYTREDISRISMGREKITQFSGRIRIVKVRIKDRRRPIRIRPLSFWHSADLMHELAAFKKRNNL
jgi:hypothetical protein